MRLVQTHDFTDNPNYLLSHVLVYDGTAPELMDVGFHCHIYCKGQYTTSELIQVSSRLWRQSFHFLKKSDAMFCKLRHDV